LKASFDTSTNVGALPAAMSLRRNEPNSLNVCREVFATSISGARSDFGSVAGDCSRNRGLSVPKYHWRSPCSNFAYGDTPAIAALKKEVVQLKVALADKTLEADFFRGALQSIEDRRRNSGSNGDPASTSTSKK
jgi:hypothetical protein